ncbi:MAG: rod shape-determining protein MreD [Clostridiales bacterium]|nr:rod shape-determining protein MreD [Clostridiales bacterium]
MSLSHENKNIYIRRALYALLLLLTAVLQNTQGLFPEIFGVRAMLLIPAVVCIGMHERDVAGLFFGLFAGVLWDAFSAGPPNFNAIMLTVAGYVCGLLIGSIMRNNIMTALLLSTSFIFIYNTAYWLFAYVVKGYDNVFEVYLRFYLPSVLYTVFFMPIFYYLVRTVKLKAS